MKEKIRLSKEYLQEKGVYDQRDLRHVNRQVNDVEYECPELPLIDDRGYTAKEEQSKAEAEALLKSRFKNYKK